MPTDLRAALRAACDMIDSGSSLCVDCGNGRTADEFRALADAPPTVAEMLSMVDATHEVQWWSDEGGRNMRAVKASNGPSIIVEIERGIGRWQRTELCINDLTAPARLVEVSP